MELSQENVIQIATAMAAMNKTATAPTQGNNFDFNAFNALVNPVGAGLKVALAQNLLEDAIRSFERYHNPLSDDLISIGSELREFRVKYKAAVAERNNKPASEGKESVASRGGV